MKILIVFLGGMFAFFTSLAQSPVGKWKKISHVSTYDGQTFDSHKALLQQRPCAAKIVWEINADGSFRLNAANSGCDENYKKFQEKLYAKNKWKLEGKKFTISATDFAIGQSYTIVFSGDKMIMKGTEGQGTIIYQKL